MSEELKRPARRAPFYWDKVRKDFVPLMVDQSTYALLNFAACNEGLSIFEYLAKLIEGHVPRFAPESSKICAVVIPRRDGGGEDAIMFFPRRKKEGAANVE